MHVETYARRLRLELPTDSVMNVQWVHDMGMFSVFITLPDYVSTMCRLRQPHTKQLLVPRRVEVRRAMFKLPHGRATPA